MLRAWRLGSRSDGPCWKLRILLCRVRWNSRLVSCRTWNGRLWMHALAPEVSEDKKIWMSSRDWLHRKRWKTPGILNWDLPGYTREVLNENVSLDNNNHILLYCDFSTKFIVGSNNAAHERLKVPSYPPYSFFQTLRGSLCNEYQVYEDRGICFLPQGASRFFRTIVRNC